MKIYGKNLALEALKENKKIHKIYLSSKFKDEEIYVALNLDDKAVEVNCNINVHNGIDLLTEKAVTINGKISIQPYGALIISKDNSI